MITRVLLKPITRVKTATGFASQEHKGEGGEEGEERWNWSLSRAADKTLVYSNDRGLLFGRIPSLIRFTSSAPSLFLHSFESYSSLPIASRLPLPLLLSPFLSRSLLGHSFFTNPMYSLMRDAILHFIIHDYFCLFPADLLLVRCYIDNAIRIWLRWCS